MIINLFDPTLSDVKYKTTVFSDGQPHIKFEEESFRFFKAALDAGLTSVQIDHKNRSSDDLMILMLTTQVIRNIEAELDLSPIKIHLNMPYFWTARMDRLMNRSLKNEPFTLKLTADLINLQKFSKVTVLDPHSDVTPALVKNIDIINQSKLLRSFLAFREQSGEDSTLLTLVSPDAGAYKKCYDNAQEAGFKGLITNAIKHRDIETGHIQGTTVPILDFGGADTVILDDLCDGGRTFIELAKVLRKNNAGKIYLIVSHAIFSQGVDVLKEHFDEIWTTNSFLDPEKFSTEDGKLFILNAF